MNADDFASFTQTPCASATLDSSVIARLSPTLGVQFEPADRSYRHLLELVIIGPAAQLDADLRAMLGTTGTCSNLTSTTTDAGEVIVEDLIVPLLGDQHFAYLLIDRDAVPPQTTWHVREAVVRVGSIAVSLGLTEILTSPQQTPAVSNAEFARLLEAAVGRTGKVQRDT